MQIFLFILLLLLIFIVIWAISSYLTSFSGAPYLPTSKRSIKSIQNMKIFKKGNVLYDLGSGHGNLLISFVKHNDIRGVGIEKDPIKYFLSKLNIKLNKLDNRINIIHGDIFTTNLKDADVVYCYLLQKTNEKLRKKLESELKKGTRIISHYFSFPDWKEIVYDKKSHTYLYVSGKSYKMKK